jgi:hypothetical protein
MKQGLVPLLRVPERSRRRGVVGVAADVGEGGSEVEFVDAVETGEGARRGAARVAWASADMLNVRVL